MNYTLTYLNEGAVEATGTEIIDNYDENHLTNIRNVVTPTGVTMTDDGSQMTFAIGNVGVGSGGTITYEATISPTAPFSQNITNTGTVVINETDSDPTDNEDTATVRVASLLVDLDKTANPTTVGNSQIVDYTITVTNNESTAKDVIITDTYGINGGRINGTNGGHIQFQTASQNVVFSGSGSASGDLGTPSGITLSGLGAGDSATIQYKGFSSYVGIPTNGSSPVVNTATLTYQGNPVYNDQQTVTILGPTSSTSSSSSSGGGGIYITTNPGIKKYVSLDGEKFYDADTASDSMPLEKAAKNLVTYKVKVKNDSSMALANVKIEDEYEPRKSKISRLEVKNVEGATYEDGVFTIEEIEKRSTAIFTYQVDLKTNAVIPNASSYNEVTVTDYERTRSVRGTKKTGQKDKAYIILLEEEKEEPSEQLLRKFSNKQAINDEEELIYTIILKNVYDYDLKNVVVKDNYDESKLKIISAPGVDNGAALTFRRTIVRPGQSVIFRYTAKGINKTKKAIKATNYVKITSETVDLSKHYAEKTITIYPFDEPIVLLKSGV